VNLEEIKARHNITHEMLEAMAAIARGRLMCLLVARDLDSYREAMQECADIFGKNGRLFANAARKLSEQIGKNEKTVPASQGDGHDQQPML